MAVARPDGGCRPRWQRSAAMWGAGPGARPWLKRRRTARFHFRKATAPATSTSCANLGKGSLQQHRWRLGQRRHRGGCGPYLPSTRADALGPFVGEAERQQRVALFAACVLVAGAAQGAKRAGRWWPCLGGAFAGRSPAFRPAGHGPIVTATCNPLLKTSFRILDPHLLEGRRSPAERDRQLPCTRRPASILVFFYGIDFKSERINL